MKDIKETALYFFISLIIVSGVLFLVLSIPPEIGKLIISIMLGLFIFIGFILYFQACQVPCVWKIYSYVDSLIFTFERPSIRG